MKQITAAMLCRRNQLRWQVASDLIEAMDLKKVNNSKLARSMGVSRAHVSYILSGDHNMTLNILSDMCLALGVEIKFTVEPTG